MGALHTSLAQTCLPGQWSCKHIILTPTGRHQHAYHYTMYRLQALCPLLHMTKHLGNILIMYSQTGPIMHQYAKQDADELWQWHLCVDCSLLSTSNPQYVGGIQQLFSSTSKEKIMHSLPQAVWVTRKGRQTASQPSCTCLPLPPTRRTPINTVTRPEPEPV